jgi:plasmid maintenance system antidote protein VapI
MSDNKELTDAVIAAAKEIDGKKKLSCQTAFDLAEKFGVSKETLGQACNDSNIKISDCQLGCFK